MVSTLAFNWRDPRIESFWLQLFLSSNSMNSSKTYHIEMLTVESREPGILYRNEESILTTTFLQRNHSHLSGLNYSWLSTDMFMSLWGNLVKRQPRPLHQHGISALIGPLFSSFFRCAGFFCLGDLSFWSLEQWNNEIITIKGHWSKLRMLNSMLTGIKCCPKCSTLQFQENCNSNWVHYQV